MKNVKTGKVKGELLGLTNIGPATAGDLERLGIRTIEKLKKSDPKKLYERLAKMDGYPHDICVLDVFTAIIENAKTGDERSWWYYSRLRKARK
ncbi:MAG: helix-hairpin-helix domain-containing protein [Ignavibacteriota bacterium]